MGHLKDRRGKRNNECELLPKPEELLNTGGRLPRKQWEGRAWWNNRSVRSRIRSSKVRPLQHHLLQLLGKGEGKGYVKTVLHLPSAAEVQAAVHNNTRCDTNTFYSPLLKPQAEGPPLPML